MKGGYRWAKGAPLPLIEDHSRAKHDVLHAYVVNYLRILAQSPRSEGVRVTFVDGFAGGGQYRTPAGDVVSGSPLVLLDAINEARALVVADRLQRGFKSPYVIDAHVHLVETLRETHAFLTEAIRARADVRDGLTTVTLHQGTFQAHLAAIIADIRKRQRNGRSVFVLDQYGWSKVDVGLIQQIFAQLPTSEVFLTWMIDNLANFVSEANVESINKALGKTGLGSHLTAERLLQIKRDGTESTDQGELTWRRAIQSMMSHEIRLSSGANFCTPFYIVPQTSRRGYWLLHLSRHLRANEEMKRIHWQNNNFHHPGGAGLDMLGYVGSGGQLTFDHRFDDHARDRTLEALRDDIPRRLAAQSGPMRFGDLVASTANDTPAQRAQLQQAVFTLAQHRELTLRTLLGSERRSAQGVADDDVIERPHQLWLLPAK